MKYLFALLLPFAVHASMWPDSFGAFHRTAVQPLEVSDRPLWDEYGFQQAEQAQYESGAQKFTATAYRLQDSTGALAAFEWQRPGNGKPSPVAKLSVETPADLMLAHGNYVLFFHGYKATAREIDALYQTLPSVDQSPLPPLSGYLPRDQRVANSERYVTGPVGLQKFDVGIPPSTAAFHMGAEAEMARFRAPGGELSLAIFSYPTPQIARERLVDFQRISGAMAKRAGPLVAVVLRAASPDDAERLLAKVRYEPAITWNERVPTARDNIGNLIINAFQLIGILLAFCVVAGLAYGGIRTFLRRGGPGDEADRMITLHLSDQ